ncbi:substrate-binding domain-containing protein [Paenibacillus sp. PL91]|uniref:substrate-binding domain-containing protein n=1 Tax=Paenibacillus sp. PL91 TaxID=2729538 RepID=UPI00145E3434|nr:substrate-binding domain-containing protein [Paenibacillus sp. PL91]MBC9201426.1 substrate-binding domain-containing protein [Paenibacillus sp. PL91]
MVMKKGSIISLLLFLAAAYLLYAALYPDEQEPKEERAGKTIQLILRTSKGDYWQNVTMGAQAAVKEFGINLHVSAPTDEGDVAGQLQTAMQSLETKPDAIVLGANDDAAFEPFLKEAAKRHIPVIAIDSLLTSGETKSYIGMDNYLAGKEAVREMAGQLGGEGDVAMVTYTKGGINGKLREQGIRDAVAEFEGIRLVDSQPCSDEYSECQQTVSGMLDKQKVDGILSLNTETSIGAALELKRRQAGEKIKLIGFDSSPELLELLQENQLQLLIVQNPFSMGYLGVKQSLEALQGKQVSARVEMDMEFITEENMFWLKNQKLLFPIVQ